MMGNNSLKNSFYLHLPLISYLGPVGLGAELRSNTAIKPNSNVVYPSITGIPK